MTTPPTPDIKTLQGGPNLTEQVASSLLNDIVGNRYRLGEVLPSEQSLATSFGVSRTVLREAISRLKAEGLVATRQGVGVIVTSNRRSSFQLQTTDSSDLDEILQVVELRLGLETEAAALAAMRRKAKDLHTMEEALEQMATALSDGDVPAGVRADVNFHRALCAATGNPHYEALFAYLSQFFRENISVSRDRSARRAGQGYQAQTEHEAIHEAIASGNPDRARECARRHVENTALRLSSRNASLPPGTKREKAGNGTAARD